MNKTYEVKLLILKDHHQLPIICNCLTFIHEQNLVGICRNPSFGLATKAKGIARVRAKGKPGS
jgi:hypothetical protein